MSAWFSSCLQYVRPVCRVLVLSVVFSSCLHGSRPVCSVSVLTAGFSSCLHGSRPACRVFVLSAVCPSCLHGSRPVYTIHVPSTGFSSRLQSSRLAGMQGSCSDGVRAWYARWPTFLKSTRGVPVIKQCCVPAVTMESVTTESRWSQSVTVVSRWCQSPASLQSIYLLYRPTSLSSRISLALNPRAHSSAPSSHQPATKKKGGILFTGIRYPNASTALSIQSQLSFRYVSVFFLDAYYRHLCNPQSTQSSAHPTPAHPTPLQTPTRTHARTLTYTHDTGAEATTHVISPLIITALCTPPTCRVPTRASRARRSGASKGNLTTRQTKAKYPGWKKPGSDYKKGDLAIPELTANLVGWPG